MVVEEMHPMERCTLNRLAALPLRSAVDQRRLEQIVDRLSQGTVVAIVTCFQFLGPADTWEEGSLREGKVIPPHPVLIFTGSLHFFPSPFARKHAAKS